MNAPNNMTTNLEVPFLMQFQEKASETSAISGEYNDELQMWVSTSILNFTPTQKSGPTNSATATGNLKDGVDHDYKQTTDTYAD